MSAPRHRLDVEGLRGVAVLLVVAQHAFAWPSGGFVGVDVFFVISGYVITAGLLREYDATGTISIRSFVARRMRRLLPAAVLVVVVTVVVARFVFYTPRFLQVLWDAGASVVSVQNWRLVRQGADYFQEGSASPLQHYWSLSVEEQFYVLWPLLLLALLSAAIRRWPARPRRVLAVAIGIGIVVSFTASVLESVFRPGWAYFSLESRAWELGVGALLAVLAPRVALLHRAARRPILGGGILLLIGAALLLDGEASFPGPWGLVPVLGAAAIVVSGEGVARAPLRVIEHPVLTATGRLSYSLYLWHFPAVVFLGTLVWWSPVLAGALAVVVSVLLAAITVRFVERPFRRSREGSVGAPASSRRADVAVAVVAVTALVVVVGVQIRGPAAIVDVPELTADRAVAAPLGEGTSAGPFSEQSTLSRAIDAALSDGAWPAGSGPDTLWPSAGAAQAMAEEGCLVEASVAAETMRDVAERCAFGDANAERTAVVVGDSIAISWLPGIVDALVPHGWRVVGLGVESCPAIEVQTAERVGRAEFVAECDAARAESLREVGLLHPDLVVISSALGSYERLLSGARGEDAIDEWGAGLEAALREVSSTGADTVVLPSPPETVAVAQCASPLVSAAACERSPSASWFEKSAAEQSAVARTGGGARFVPVGSWFCDAGGRCPAAVDGTIVTADGGHLTEAYSMRLAVLLRAALIDP